jgi:predicted RNA-binding Zn ribbon-like protein
MRTIEQNLNLEDERLCLDFANTAEWHLSEVPIEHLNTYADLVHWERGKGLLDASAAHRLLEAAEAHPQAAEETLLRAVALREAIYAIFSAAADGRAADPSNLEIFNRELERLMPGTRLAREAGGYLVRWQGQPAALDGVLGDVLLSAVDLLTSDDLSRVGQCADDRGCGWLFIDRSKNHSRQWCAMNDCGNRAKARRHYQKIKQTPNLDE